MTNKMNKILEEIEFGFSFIISALFAIGYFCDCFNLMIALEFILVTLIFCQCFLRKNYLVFLFLTIFLFFQMNRIFLDFFNLTDEKWYRGYVGDYFDNDIQKHLILCYYLVLYGLFLSLFVHIKNWKKHTRNSVYFSDSKINIQISYFLCLLFLIPSILQNLLAVKHVMTYGYFDYYKNFNPPYILTVLSGMSYVFIFCYFSVTKKIHKLFILFYIVNFTTSLLIGSRKDFVLYLLLLVFYLWNTRNSFSLKKIMKMLIPVFCLFMFLFYVGFKRQNAVKDIEKYKTNPIVLFLDLQGVSIVVPGYEKKYETEIPKRGIAYLFPNQIKMITNLLGTTIDRADRKKSALEGFYISQFISYKVLGDRFVIGEGLGGCFVADIYYCFSYLGVFFYSLLLGIFMRHFEKGKKNSLSYVVVLSCVYNLLYIPRSQALDIFIQITSAKFWFSVIFFFLFIEIIKNQIPKKNFNNKIRSVDR